MTQDSGQEGGYDERQRKHRGDCAEVYLGSLVMGKMFRIWESLLTKKWFRIVILLCSPLLGAIALFFATFLISGILDLTIFPDAGEVGWVFCFVTIPAGMVAAPIATWRYIKRSNLGKPL